MEFSEKLLELRRGRGMSQEDLGALIGVSRQAVSKWETGEAMPDLQKLLALADVLDVSLDILCAREMATVEKCDIPAVPAKKCFVWQSICAALTIFIIVLSALLLWPEKKDDIVIDMKFSEATFFSGNGHSLRYRIIPDSVSSTCSYQLLLTPETPVAGAPAPVELDASSGVFQGELTFPLTASTWSVSLRVTSPNEVRIVPVAAGLHYRDTGMVSWDPVLK